MQRRETRIFGGLLFMAMCMPAVALAQAGPHGNCKMTVQDAINYAILTGNPDVYIAPGVYVESLYVDGGDVRLIAAKDSSCTSQAPPGTRTVRITSAGGSTITIINHDVTLVNIEVTGGDAAVGGNIYTESDGHLTLVDSRVYGGNAKLGGGIALVDCGQIIVDERSLVDNNKAQYGGGIAVTANQCHRFNLEMHGNMSTNTATAQGGHVYLQRASMELTGAIGGGNGFNRGGCIAAYDNSEIVAARAKVAGCKTSNANSRGGILHLENSQAYLYRTTFDNSASVIGGSISAEAGSVVLAEESHVTRGNAEGDGGLVHAVDSMVQFVDSYGYEGTAKWSGGAFFLDKSRLDLDGTTELAFNTAENGEGGAVFATNDSLVEVMGNWQPAPEPRLPTKGVQVVKNFAFRNGGGFQIINNSNLWGTGLVAAYNTAKGHGGAISAEAGNVNLARTVVQENSARLGGGVSAAPGGTVLLRGGNCDPVAEGFPKNRYCSEIRYNVAAYGGGAWAYHGTLRLDRVAMIDNVDEAMEGNAILLWREGRLIMRNVLVETAHPGAATLTSVDDDAIIEAEHVTFGEGTYVKLDGTTTGWFNHSVFDWAVGGVDGGAIHNGQVIGDCNVGRGAGSFWGFNNVHADPKFIDTGRGRHRLDASSPALDRCWGSTSDDLDGVFRPVGNGDDSGAFEMP